MKENKFKELFRVIKFTIISISAGLIQIGSFTLINEIFDCNYWVAYIPSLLLSIIWNFTINRKITFKSSNNVTKSMILVLLFYAVFTPLSTLLGTYLTSINVNEYIVQGINMLLNFVLEFLYTRYIVYRNSCDTINTEKKKDKPLIYRIIRWFITSAYKKKDFINIKNLPDEPCIIIGNHAQIYGPLACALYYPRNKSIWCRSEMLKASEVPAYAYEDFWSRKPKITRFFYKILSYLIAIPISYILKHSYTQPVYKDARIASTFKSSIESLNQGKDIIIFPEGRTSYNNIINDFQDKYVDLARFYFKKYGKEIYFVPMYSAPYLKKIIIGKPIKYDSKMNIDEQRKIICDYLKQEITNEALNLPKHKVVPYDNLSKKDYPYSK